MNRTATIFGLIFVTFTLVSTANAVGEPNSVKIFINSNRYDSVPYVLIGNLKPLEKTPKYEAILDNQPFMDFDVQVGDHGQITLTAYKPTVAIDEEGVGGYTGGILHGSTFNASELRKLGVSVIQIARPEMPKSLPTGISEKLTSHYTLSPGTIFEPISPRLDRIEIVISGRKTLITVHAVTGFIRSVENGSVGGIQGGAMAKGTFTLSEFSALVGSDALSEYFIRSSEVSARKKCAVLTTTHVQKHK
jgi:hypothetical protein